MTLRHFKRMYQKLIFFVVASTLSLAANSATEEVVGEKRIELAMRMIGHEVLMCMGDHESRVMPIEEIGDQYKISFEFEFGFDPYDMVSIIEQVIAKTGIAAGCFVEIQHCETKEVVHSFEIGYAMNPDWLPCVGRLLPKDCYDLMITILDDSNFRSTVLDTAADHSLLMASEAEESNLSTPSFLIISILLLVGFTAYFFKKKNLATVDQDRVLIGASEFDKRNMALSFKNKVVELSNKEAELLSLLHTSANAPVEREYILQEVWGDEGDYVGRTLDVFISKLRKKLEADTSVKIVNIRGVGYKLVMNA